MYLGYFGLTERPFSIAPDPRYLFMSGRHKEAMAHLSYGLSQGGCFIVLTGEVGTGKTTLWRNLLHDLPSELDVALILNTNITESELLQTICDELKIQYNQSHSQKQLLDLINEYLLGTFADNRHTVLIIDEAQLLSRDVLEQVRLLTNLETTRSKLLQIILIGQPELNVLLSRNDLRQLAQRVTARYHLQALRRVEIEDYVNYRLSVAGCKQPLFSKQALSELHRQTGGIPRRINVLADHSLLSAYSKNQTLVDSKTVKQVSQEVFIQTPKSTKYRFNKNARWPYAVAALLLVNIGLWWWFAGNTDSVEQTAAVEVTPITRAQANQSTKQPEPAEASPPTEEVSAGEVRFSDAAVPSVDLGAQSTGRVVDGSGLTSIQKPSQVKPGSVVIADQPLNSNSPVVAAARALPERSNVTPDTKFGRVLETSADRTGRIIAFRTLSAAWDADLPNKLIRPACVELREQGIDCIIISSWPQLLRFNRPSILLLDHQGQLHRVIVFKIDDDVAQVLVGEDVYSVSVAELKQRWVKSGLTFWRPSALGGRLLYQGQQSQSMPLLRRQINRALAEADLPLLRSTDSSFFDSEMARSVFALQSAYGITADSKVGKETYLLLNELVVPDATPVLVKRLR